MESVSVFHLLSSRIDPLFVGLGVVRICVKPLHSARRKGSQPYRKRDDNPPPALLTRTDVQEDLIKTEQSRNSVLLRGTEGLQQCYGGFSGRMSERGATRRGKTSPQSILHTCRRIASRALGRDCQPSQSESLLLSPPCDCTHGSWAGDSLLVGVIDTQPKEVGSLCPRSSCSKHPRFSA